MKVVFFDQLGCYAAVVAAAYMAGIIGENPQTTEIIKLDTFAAHHDWSPGNLNYIGRNSQNEELYTLGIGKRGSLIAASAQDLCKIMAGYEEIKIIDVSAYNSPIIKIAAYLKLNRMLQRTAVFIAAYFLKKRMPQIVRKVRY